MTKVLAKTPWLEIHDKDGYGYVHESKDDGGVVCILVYKDDKILGRFETRPAHGSTIDLYSVTGMVENKDPIGTAVMELKEETGYIGLKEDMEYLGILRPYKAGDCVVHAYAFDATDKEWCTPTGDGSEMEKGAYCEWIPRNTAAMSRDPLLPAMMLRQEILKG